jgi:hypothetical protein
MSWAPTAESLEKHKAIIKNFTIDGMLLQAGYSEDELRDYNREELEDTIFKFIDDNNIGRENYQYVMQFYSKAYAQHRSALPDNGQIEKRDPKVWALRMKFLEECKKEGISWAQKLSNQGFTFIRCNFNVLNEEGIAVIASHVALTVAKLKAREKTLAYLNSNEDAGGHCIVHRAIKSFERNQLNNKQ